MRVVKQKTQINVQNFDNLTEDFKENKNRHGDLLPNSIRCLVVGPSGSGKTSVVLNLIFDPNGLNFENIYVFSKTLYQPKYRFLAKVLPKEVGYFAYNENSSVIHPNEAKPNSVMIFDDISTEKHDNIRNYFTMGRHNKIDTFYLGQTYSKIPKQLIRDNANFIVLFGQDLTNLKHIFTDHVGTDISFETFKNLCSTAWKTKNQFLVIDKNSDLNKGRYRIGFDNFIQNA